MSKKIFIGEKRISNLSNLITENWADTKRTIVKRTINVLRGIFPEASEEELSNMEGSVLRRFFHGRAKSNPKLRPIEPLIAKILYGEVGIQNKFMYDKYKLFKLMKVFRNIKVLANNNIKPEFNINDTLSSLGNRYGYNLEDLEKLGIDTSKKEIAKGNNDYECLEIEDFETANEYGQYTCPDGELCYTQDEDTWNDENYSNDGVNTCYVFLRNGWENEPAKDGEDSPYDDYGLSMIWIFLNPEGNIVTSNSRWNHHNDEYLPKNRDVDYSFDEADINEITGYDVNELENNSNVTPDFLEKTEKFKRFIENGGDVQEAYYNGLVDDVKKYGDGIFIVSVGNSNTFIKNNEFLYPNLWVDIFKIDDLLKLFCNKSVNIMFPDGELLANDNVWFKDARYISGSKVFITANENGSNIYDLNKTPLLRENAKIISVFYSHGEANFDLLHVCLKDNEWYIYSLQKRDFIIKEPSLKKIEPIQNSDWLKFTDSNGFIDLIRCDGRRLYGEGVFKWIGYEFINGLLEVHMGKNGKKNLINTNGELMVSEDMNLGYNFTKIGDFGVLCEINDQYCVVGKNGVALLTDAINELIENNPDIKAYSMGDNIFYEDKGKYGNIEVKRGYENIKNIVINNRVISKDWFEDIIPIWKGGFICKRNYRYNILKPNGELVFNTDAREVKTWKPGYLIAEFDDKDRWGHNTKVYAIVNSNTFEIEYSDIDEIKSLSDDETPTPVRFRGFSNFIKSDGKLLNSIKYSSVSSFNKYGWAETYQRSQNGEGYNVVFKDGSILSNELYKKILGGNEKIIIIENNDKEIYIVSISDRKEIKYSYDMFPYLYKEGFGEVFGDFDNKWSNKLEPFNMIRVWIKENPANDSFSNRNNHVGCNIINLETNDFIFPKFYDFISTKDGKIFEVANWNERYYDIIDINSNSLLGGRRPSRIEGDYSPIGSYEIDFDDNGNKYREFYDENFNLIQRMTEQEFEEWEAKKYGY